MEKLHVAENHAFQCRHQNNAREAIALRIQKQEEELQNLQHNAKVSLKPPPCPLTRKEPTDSELQPVLKDKKPLWIEERDRALELRINLD